jgi:hypothetical protein
MAAELFWALLPVCYPGKPKKPEGPKDAGSEVRQHVSSDPRILHGTVDEHAVLIDVRFLLSQEIVERESLLPRQQLANGPPFTILP